MKVPILSDHTISILRDLQKYILTVPERFNLGAWGSICDPKHYNIYDERGDFEDDDAVLFQRPPCGAVGCLAGNLCIMRGLITPKIHFNGDEVYQLPWDTLEQAKTEADLTDEQAKRLFFLKSWLSDNVLKDEEGNNVKDEFGQFVRLGWPDDFEERLLKAQPGTKEYAQVGFDRIELFILTGGAE